MEGDGRALFPFCQRYAPTVWVHGVKTLICAAKDLGFVEKNATQ